MRQRLPYIDLKNWQGLFTKSSPDILAAEQLRVAENCDYFDTYGAVSKLRGNTRVLNNKITEGGSPVPISWVGFYKASDLDGRILRKVLLSAGTRIGEIENGNFKVLCTGRLSGLFHTADRIDRFLFITNQDPNIVGRGDDLLKYDGAVLTNWGLTPPGSQETVFDAFADIDYTTFNATIRNEPTDGTGVTFDGDALRIDKFYVDSSIFFVEREFYYPWSFYPIADGRVSEKSVADRVNFQLFIPRGLLTPSKSQYTGGIWNTNPAISVKVSPDQDTVDNNHWSFYFPIGQLFEGWNKLNLDFSGESPSGKDVGEFYPEIHIIKRIRYAFHTKKDDVFPLKRLRLDRLVRLDQGAPAVRQSGTGSLSGVYQYKVTFLSKYGNESNAGPASAAFTAVSAGQLDLTKIPVSSDPQITTRNLYRTVANGSVFLFLDQILDNETTVYTDTTPDGSLGNQTPPQAGDFSDDNSPPPKAGIVQQWKRTLFLAGDPQNPEILYFSEDNDPESFPLINTFTLDSKITAMYQTYSGLVVETETGKWQVIGDNPDFAVDKIIEGMGCVGRRAAGTTRLEGYSVDRDGLRLFNLSSTNKISEPIRDKFDELNKENIELIHTVHSKNRNSLTQFNPDANKEYTSAFHYNYPIDDISVGFWTELNIPSAINILDTEEVEDSNGDFKIYAGGDDGMVYELFASGANNWIDADGNETAVVTKITTPYLRLGELGAEVEGVIGKVVPQFIEVRTKGDATTWSVTIDMADGVDQDSPSESKTIDVDFTAGQALRRKPIPSPSLAARNYVRLTLENSDLDVSSTLLAVRLYFHVRPFAGEQ